MQAKFLILGSQGSGKSNFMLRYFDNTCTESYTFLSEPRKKVIELNSQEVTVVAVEQNLIGGYKVQGQYKKNLKDRDFVLITVDLTDEASLKTVDQIVADLKATYMPLPPLILVGTKSDRKQARCITDKQLQAKQAEVGAVAYFPTSAYHGENVDAVIEFGVRHKLSTFKEPIGPEIRTRPEIIDSILADLNDYTSFSNQASANAKWFFSLGRFSLGLEKQKLVDALKGDLLTAKGNDEDLSKIIDRYREANAKLVRVECKHSFSVFKVNYINIDDKSDALSYNRGNLGNILERALNRVDTRQPENIPLRQKV